MVIIPTRWLGKTLLAWMQERPCKAVATTPLPTED